MIPFHLVPFGFTWGPAKVQRIMSLPRGAVVLTVEGAPGVPPVEVYVSPKGRAIRVFQGGAELTAP